MGCMTSPPSPARLRVSITPAVGPEEWFGRQLNAIRAAGAHYDPPSRTWFRWLDVGDLEELAAVLTAAAAAAREFGATVHVETETPLRATSETGRLA